MRHFAWNILKWWIMNNQLFEYLNSKGSKSILSGISIFTISSSTMHMGSISMEIGRSQLTQSSQLQSLPHFRPAAKHVQYFLLHLVFLHVQDNLISISLSGSGTALIFFFISMHSLQQKSIMQSSLGAP